MTVAPPPYRPGRDAALQMMRSRQVVRALDKAAERGLRAFQAGARRRTGAFARSARIENAPGRDGRPGRRIVVRGDGVLSIEFGTRHQRPAHSLQGAILAIEGRRSRGRG
jgi:hypothetical protein